MKWISVEEKLPIPYADVIMCYRSQNERHVFVGYYDPTEHRWVMPNIWAGNVLLGLDDVPVQVTHWIPLPEFPKEESFKENIIS